MPGIISLRSRWGAGVVWRPVEQASFPGSRSSGNDSRCRGGKRYRVHRRRPRFRRPPALCTASPAPEPARAGPKTAHSLDHRAQHQAVPTGDSFGSANRRTRAQSALHASGKQWTALWITAGIAGDSLGKSSGKSGGTTRCSGARTEEPPQYALRRVRVCEGRVAYAHPRPYGQNRVNYCRVITSHRHVGIEKGPCTNRGLLDELTTEPPAQPSPPPQRERIAREW